LWKTLLPKPDAGQSPPEERLKQIALGLHKSTRHLPVLRAAVDRAKQATTKFVKAKIDYQQILPGTPRDPDFDFVARLYGITVDDLRNMEEMLFNSELPFKLSHPVALKCLSIDNPIKPNDKTAVIMPDPPTLAMQDLPWDAVVFEDDGAGVGGL
jgi:hypothetical protein